MIPSSADYRRRIKELRQEADLTQQEAAEAANVSQSFVTKVERGDTVPRYDHAARLYNTLEQIAREDVETASDLIQHEIIAATPASTVSETTQLMKDNGFSQLPVIDNERCVGSVTSRSLLNAAPDDPIQDHMTAPFPEIGAATPRDAVIELLKNERAVLVRDETGLQGIITAADVL